MTDTSFLLAPFSQSLEIAALENRERRNKVVIPTHRPEIQLENRTVIDFCSNDYLGLANHPALKIAAINAISSHGVGTGGARLIGGTLDLHAELEAELAAFKQTEAALVFNSGYQANVGILSALADRHSVIFADKLNHASLVDGAILSRAEVVRYPHLDLDALEARLKQVPKNKRKLIVTDTVFSMDGDTADLSRLYSLSTQYNALLILDEAHATGLFGSTHRSGLWETTGIGHQSTVLQIGTFSKALGSFGAYVAGSQLLICSLIQQSRSYIYSTSLPPAVIATNLAALRLLSSDSTQCEMLWRNIHYLKSLLTPKGLLFETDSAIFPIIIGEDAKTLEVAQSMLEKGFYVQAIRPPTIPKGTSRLRLTVSANHTTEMLDALVVALNTVLNR